MFTQLRRRVTTLVMLVPLASCGSGFAAIFQNDGSSSGGPPNVPPPPTIVANVGSTGPLFPAPDTLVNVEVQNYDLTETLSRITVELRAFGTVVDKQHVLRVPRPNTIQFVFGTFVIQAMAKQIWGSNALTTRDVPVHLAVLVDGADVAAPVPILLLRQPTAEIENRPARLDLSPFGQVITARLKSVSHRLPDTNSPVGDPEYTREFLLLNEMEAKIAVGHTPDALLVQQFTPITSVVPQSNGDLLVRIAMPAVDHPSQVHFAVDSSPSGRTTLVSNAYYRPEVSVAFPTTGATEGGATVVVFGKAMVPLDAANPPALDFSRLTLTIKKAGRETLVDINRIQVTLSNAARLRFTMPAAPDGRPGPTDVHVRVQIEQFAGDAIEVETTSKNVFHYGDTYPYFGPRGVQMRDRPSVVRFSPFVDSRRSVVDALSISGGPGGMPYASVYRTRGNGLFTRFGQPLQAGLANDRFQRTPIDLCIGDFIGDDTRSGLILNRGEAGLARHSLVLGSDTSNPPISFDEDFQLALERSGRSCEIGDFNNDGITDLVVLSFPLPQQNSSTPVVFLSAGSPRDPRFLRSDFSTYASSFQFTAVDVADLDGDSEQDLVFANGGDDPRLLIAFGNSNGGFLASDIVDMTGAGFDLSVAGYTPHPASTVLGVHVLEGSGQPTIAMVFSGVAGSTQTPPAVVHIRRASTKRGFEAVISSDILTFAGGQRVFTHSASGDLFGSTSTELVVSADSDVAEPLRLFTRVTGRGFEQIKNSMDLGVGRLESISGVGIDLATAPGSHHQATGRRAVFVTHTQSLAGGTEHRVSTFLVDSKSAAPRLLSPHAARKITDPILGTALGRFFAKSPASPGVAMDAWLAIRDGLISLENDGLGEFAVAPSTVSAVGILPSTLAKVEAGAVAGGTSAMPAFLTKLGRLAVVLPSNRTKLVHAGVNTPVDLRSFAPAYLRSREVRPNSSIHCADVDQDGYLDLVVMMSLAPGQDLGLEFESVLLLFPGQQQPKAGEFPFDLPDPSKSVSSLTHGNVNSLAIGDFVTSNSLNQLELVVALPLGGSLGNEVRFYRWDPSRQMFSHSFVSQTHHALPVGNEPEQIAAGDYNADGKVDIAVASGKDNNLWVFYNFSVPGTSVEVDLKRFQGAPANPLALPVGTPRKVLSGDVNGDGVPDVIVMVETGTSIQEQQVVYYLSPGRLGGSGIRAIPHERTGNHILIGGNWVPRNAAAAIAFGDLNGDGAPDLILGWNTAGVGDYNLRVLFGNNF